MSNPSDSDPAAAVRSLLSPPIDDEERRRCVDVLRLRPDASYRMVASGVRDKVSARSAEIDTPFGRGRASVIDADEPNLPRAAGIGLAVPPVQLADSWRQALVAIRLTGPSYPRVRFDDLGILAELVPTTGRVASHPDIEALASLPIDVQDVLETLIVQPSVRATASALGLHHSSVQQRLDAVDAHLGFAVRSPPGRFRLAVALLLARAVQFTFPAAQ